MTTCLITRVQDWQLQHDTNKSRHRLFAQSTTVPCLHCTPSTSCLWLSECHLTNERTGSYTSLHGSAGILEQSEHDINVCGMHRSKIHTMHSSPFQHLVVKTSGQEGHKVSKKKKQKKHTSKVQARKLIHSLCISEFCIIYWLVTILLDGNTFLNQNSKSLANNQRVFQISQV